MPVINIRQKNLTVKIKELLWQIIPNLKSQLKIRKYYFFCYNQIAEIEIGRLMSDLR